MRVPALAAAFFALAASVLFAHAGTTVQGPDGNDWLIPEGSVVGAPLAAQNGVTFPGEFVLSGNLHIIGVGETTLVYLKPDAAVAAHLPRWKNSYRIDQIWFENNDALVAAAIPASVLAAYRAHKIPSIHRHVALDVDRFTVAVDCDGATYAVHFIRMHKPVAVAENEDAEDAC